MRIGLFDNSAPLLGWQSDGAGGFMPEGEGVSEISARMKRTLDAAPAAYALIVGGVLEEVNEYARANMGMEPGGRIPVQFFDEPGQLDMLLSDIAKDNESQCVETGLKMKNGETRRFLVSLAPVNYRRQKAFALWAIALDGTASIDEEKRRRIYGVSDAIFAEKQSAETEHISAPSANVLIVDDIQSNLTAAAGLLSKCGITADVAMSGKEAVTLVKEKDYDIVLMDHMMPEMDGVEAMKIIRGLGYDKLPIIALTVNSDDASRAFLLNSGMDDFLPKPLDFGEFMRVLKKWLPTEKLETVSGHDIEGRSAEYSEILQAISQIEGIDIGLALSRISGMQDVLEQTIRQTAFSISGHLDKMEGFLAQNNFKEFTIAAHGMKGALANIGAMRHQELSAELEILSKSENIGACLDKFAVYSELLSDLEAQLTSILTPENAASRPNGNSSFLKRKAGEAITHLESYDAADALAALDEALAFTYDEQIDKLLKEIRETTSSYKYKNAINMLKGMDV